MVPVATSNPTVAVDEHIGFVVVFGDKVLVEEAEGLFGGCGGELDDAGDFPVNVEAVVGFACCELEFAHRDSKPGHDVHVGHVLYFPPTLSQLAVNVLAGYGFGGSQS